MGKTVDNTSITPWEGSWAATVNEPTFMGFTQSELCARHDAFLKAEIEKNRKFIVSRTKKAKT